MQKFMLGLLNGLWIVNFACTREPLAFLPTWGVV
jgi:hypothetical protein